MVILNVRQSLLSIERLEYHKHGSRRKTWAAIAKRLGCIPGSIENIAKDRVKSVPAELAAKILAYWIDIIEAKIAHLEHERDLARKIHIDLSAPELGRVEALLAEARLHLDQAKKRKR